MTWLQCMTWRIDNPGGGRATDDELYLATGSMFKMTCFSRWIGDLSMSYSASENELLIESPSNPSWVRVEPPNWDSSRIRVGFGKDPRMHPRIHPGSNPESNPESKLESIPRATWGVGGYGVCGFFVFYK